MKEHFEVLHRAQQILNRYAKKPNSLNMNVIPMDIIAFQAYLTLWIQQHEIDPSELNNVWDQMFPFFRALPNFRAEIVDMYGYAIIQHDGVNIYNVPPLENELRNDIATVKNIIRQQNLLIRGDRDRRAMFDLFTTMDNYIYQSSEMDIQLRENIQRLQDKLSETESALEQALDNGGNNDPDESKAEIDALNIELNATRQQLAQYAQAFHELKQTSESTNESMAAAVTNLQNEVTYFKQQAENMRRALQDRDFEKARLEEQLEEVDTFFNTVIAPLLDPNKTAQQGGQKDFEAYLRFYEQRVRDLSEYLHQVHEKFARDEAISEFKFEILSEEIDTLRATAQNYELLRTEYAEYKDQRMQHENFQQNTINIANEKIRQLKQELEMQVQQTESIANRYLTMKEGMTRELEERNRNMEAAMLYLNNVKEAYTRLRDRGATSAVSENTAIAMNHLMQRIQDEQTYANEIMVELEKTRGDLITQEEHYENLYEMKNEIERHSRQQEQILQTVLQYARGYIEDTQKQMEALQRAKATADYNLEDSKAYQNQQRQQIAYLQEQLDEYKRALIESDAKVQQLTGHLRDLNAGPYPGDKRQRTNGSPQGMTQSPIEVIQEHGRFTYANEEQPQQQPRQQHQQQVQNEPLQEEKENQPPPLQHTDRQIFVKTLKEYDIRFKRAIVQISLSLDQYANILEDSNYGDQLRSLKVDLLSFNQQYMEAIAQRSSKTFLSRLVKNAQRLEIHAHELTAAVERYIQFKK
jgi:hypothetical protein